MAIAFAASAHAVIRYDYLFVMNASGGGAPAQRFVFDDFNSGSTYLDNTNFEPYELDMAPSCNPNDPGCVY